MAKPASNERTLSCSFDSARHQLVQNRHLEQGNYSSSCVMRWLLKAIQKKFPIMK